MATTSGVSSGTGLISGINYDQLISQLIAVDQQPLQAMQAKQQDYQVKIATFLDVSTKLSSFKAALDTLNSNSKFNTRNASVSTTSNGDQLLSVSASSSALAGSHSIQVKQLAAASSKASQGWVDQNTTAINSAGGTFEFKVGAAGAKTTISVSSTMTLQGLRDAINSTSGTGVTASIINDGTGSNPYRLILTANNTGSSNNIYITNNATSTALGFDSKKIEAAYANTTNSYSGTVTSNAGNNYTGTTNKTFLIEAVSATTYKYSIDGGINWLGSGGGSYPAAGAISKNVGLTAIDGTGTSNEGVQVSFTAGNFAVGDRFTVDVFNPDMQSAQDAVITLDNATITKSSNTITDALQGVTMSLLKADSSATLTLSVTSDTSGAKSSIKSFVNAYNTIMKAINDQLSYDPATKTKNPLLGDATLLEIRRKIANTVTGAIPGLSSTDYTNLAKIGISSDSKTGKLSLDDAKLTSALNSNPDAVARLFIGTATAADTAVSFISKTSRTQPGKYSVYVSTAPEKAAVGGSTAADTVDLSTEGLAKKEMLTFIYSANKTAATPAETTFSVELAQGATINTIVNNLNSAFATNKVGLSASNDGGKLKITSTAYGADNWFQVYSQRDDGSGGWTKYSGAGGAGNKQVWTSSYADSPVDTVIRSDAGVNIVGAINNHPAIASNGNILTSTAGFPDEGLEISVDSNQTGGFGTVSVSSGIADRLSSSVASYTDSDTGIIKLKTDSLQKSIDDLTTQENTLNDRLAREQQNLKNQFARLETMLAQYSATSQYLTNQLSSISNNWVTNKK